MEARVLLTGVIAVKIKGNNLTFVGDSANNRLRIQQNDGDVWLIALDGTTFSGDALDPTKGRILGTDRNNFVANIPADRVGNFKVNLKGGNDDFQMLRNLTIRGKTVINMGQGNDDIQYRTLGGIGTAISYGPTILKTGSGDDLVELERWNFDGDIKVTTGSGDDALLVGLIDVVTFNGKITDSLGSGNDLVSIKFENIGGTPDSVSINGGSGFDEISSLTTELEWEEFGRVKGVERFT